MEASVGIVEPEVLAKLGSLVQKLRVGVSKIHIPEREKYLLRSRHRIRVENLQNQTIVDLPIEQRHERLRRTELLLRRRQAVVVRQRRHH
jgi:hypothetical protein